MNKYQLHLQIALDNISQAQDDARLHGIEDKIAVLESLKSTLEYLINVPEVSPDIAKALHEVSEMGKIIPFKPRGEE